MDAAQTHRDRVWTPAAEEFVTALVRQFKPRHAALLAARTARQNQWDAGWRPTFLDETQHVRQAAWEVGKLPADLIDRRVEITGPVDRKMIIQALSCGANVFMADFEDSLSPVFENVLAGQVNLMDAVRRQISYVQPGTGKSYELADNVATLMVRPRGLHLRESHIEVDGAAIPASLFDFGLYFFHNAHELRRRGSGPYFYLPKLESHLEARWWNDVFVWSQKRLDLPLGTIKATVLIETLPAAFEMDEILFELKDHSAGLNCGRWDYIFSFIKKHRSDVNAIMPDRALVTMTQPFLRAYTQLLIKTCHARKVHAMGGMAAQIPVKDDAVANEAALSKVRADKLREVTDGHDGTWVAHPGLVPVAKAIFDEHMKGPNQISNRREDVKVEPRDLLAVPEGKRTLGGVAHNVRVAVRYLEAWLSGQGCVPLYGLMEDAATAEISRAQVWQWLHHGAVMDDGTKLTEEKLARIIDEQMQVISNEVGAEKIAHGKYQQARDLFSRLCTSNQFEEFLTLPAYPMLSSRA